MMWHHIPEEQVLQIIKKLQGLSSNQRTITAPMIRPQSQNEFSVYHKSSGITLLFHFFTQYWILTAQFN